ncbi:DUF3099 domain-containing protein [Corynebacterium tapiri]|uniref:DUF3099 domain-containing protein n=1 Tax=Corynebacterium tapiri TaxID=1448266 RepID=A0A5C4U547_9CORY|nr:DUF3099 domain-containing protein [Corynebacterium tapiri]TNL99203.1 DUF3099 domain-containing protein [Corynebacterium tapiri]
MSGHQQDRRRLRSWRRWLLKPELITSARRTPYQNRRRREVIYASIQLARIPFLILTFVSLLVWHNWWLTMLFLIISVPLPGIAVVLANEKGQKRTKQQRNVYKPALARKMQLEAERAAALNATAPKPLTIDHEEPEQP